MTFSVRYLTCILALGAVPASAQQAFVPGVRVPGTINIQSSLSMTVPADMSMNPAEQIEVAQKAFYAMAQRQCQLVLDTLGETCQVTNLTNNADLNRSGGSFISVRGTVTMAVKLKNSAQKP
ncbi:hypothetical protein [Rhizobium sp. Rhizsp82]|uniref:hypothetical protein n=1 Tax=Rhizobium sp. Rhizsp82 TaxID=3243057 RepID=UPI0039B4E7A4